MMTFTELAPAAGLRIFQATSANIADLGEEHGHRVLRVCGKGSKVVQVPLLPAVGRVSAAAAMISANTGHMTLAGPNGGDR
jgi:site-specific recombinase XerC